MLKIVDNVKSKLAAAAFAAGGLWIIGSDALAAGLKIANRPSEMVAVVPRPSPTDVDLIKGVAEVGAPQIVLFPKGANVAKYVADKCGKPFGNFNIHPAYEKILLERNPPLRHEDLNALPEEKAVEIPACGKFVEDVTLPAPNGVEKLAKQLNYPFDTGVFERVIKDPALRRQVQQLYGVALSGSTVDLDTALKPICSSTPNASWPGDMTSCRNAIQIAAANPQITKPNLVKDVIVPVSAQATGLPALPDAGPKDVRIALRTDVEASAVRATLPQVQELEGTFKFVTEIEDVEKFGQNCSKALELKGENWPYSLRDFLRVVSLNSSLNQDADGRRILIVDTGFDFSDTPRADALANLVFDTFYFHRLNKMSDPDAKRDANSDGVNGNGGWVGVNLSSATGKTSSATSIAFNHRSHGLAVAALALGGKPVEALRRIAHLPLHLGFASLVALDTINPQFNTGHIERTLKFAAAEGNDFNVINLSLSSKDNIPGWDDIVKNRGKKRVFVVAAGNDGNKLSGKDAVWPAAFGGSTIPFESDSAAVISVGAHDAEGKIATFSNWGLSVDVLAPGCMVPSYQLRVDGDGTAIDITPHNETGTSFSAPLVSFVSALLMNSPKLSGRPGLVKARIQTSSDYNSALREQVYSSGLLDIAKALSVDNDVIELPPDAGATSKNVRYGHVLNKSAIGELECRPGDKVAFDTIRKIARSGSDDLLVFINDDDARPWSLVRKFCDKSMADKISIQFQDVESGDTTSVAGASLLDYIPTP
ncbi:S8 family peptidase [Bradyrhizobium sp. ORS 111]|uniref:S8 family peptidase n=1 Tax=Bradyrhizobium sp. ORS 111 TaxID=1685958 RepID=UPI00388F296A